jgi:hypothetical protein
MLLGLMVNQSSVARAPGSANPPDAFSTTQSKSEGKVDPLAAVLVVKRLSGKSLMFPTFHRNNKRLTPHQKFLLPAHNRVSGTTVIGTAARAGISQAGDTKTGYGQAAEGYFKFKRWGGGAGMAFAVTSNMVGTFAIASVLQEDPRYLVENENSGRFRELVRYAVTRVFICRRDDDHRHRFGGNEHNARVLAACEQEAGPTSHGGSFVAQHR